MLNQFFSLHFIAVLLAMAGPLSAVADEATVPQSNVEKSGPSGIAVRGFREMPAEAVDYLATALKPSDYSVPLQGATVDELITARCGNGTPKAARDVIRSKLVELNPNTSMSTGSEKLPGGVIVQFPFCTPIFTDTKVEYFNNSSGLEGIVKARYPVAALETQKQAVNLTESCSGKSFEKCSRTFDDGDAITLPYSSTWATGQILDNAPPSAFLARLEELAPQFKPAVENNAVRSDAKLEYVGLLGPSETAGDKCDYDANNETHWPFDRNLVTERFTSNLATFRSKNPGRPERQAHIAVVDSGLGESLYGTLLSRSLLRANPDEKQNGVDDDRDSVVDDIYGVGFDASASTKVADFFAFSDDNRYYDHGSEVTSLVLGGIALLGSSAWHPAQPPIIVSEVRMSERLKPGTVVPSALFLSGALEWARNQNADVVNISLTHPEPNITSYQALFDKTLLVAAAGNDGEDLSVASHPSYPAYYGGMQKEPILTVGAHSQSGAILNRSDFGQKVDLLAPGCAIPAFGAKGETIRADGTSFAAPLASFTAGLLKALGMNRPLDIRNRIISGTDYDPALERYVWSSGRLNIPKAISIYDDVIEVRTASPDATSPGVAAPTKLVIGKLLTAENISSKSEELSRFCNNQRTRSLLNSQNVTKLSIFVDNDSNVRLNYLYDPISFPERQLRKEKCGLNPRETHLTIRVKKPGVDSGYEDEILSIGDIVDVIPSITD